MGLLEGKTAIITGASSGIGRAAAQLFCREGAAAIVTARSRDALTELVSDIDKQGGIAIAMAGDIRDEEFAQTLVDRAVTELGGLDIAFNNAGTLGAMGPVTEVSSDGWRDTLDTNLTSAYLGAKHQIPAMLERGGGSLIFTSTFVGHTAGMPGMAAYAASKAGLIGLAQVLAAEYGPQGIRANALLPGGTDTPMGQSVANTPEMEDFVAGLHALKRIAQPEEIAEAALYLASDRASFVTGTSLLVDGGVSINRT